MFLYVATSLKKDHHISLSSSSPSHSFSHVSIATHIFFFPLFPSLLSFTSSPLLSLECSFPSLLFIHISLLFPPPSHFLTFSSLLPSVWNWDRKISSYTYSHIVLQAESPDHDLWWAHYFKQRILICDEPTTSSRGTWSCMHWWAHSFILLIFGALYTVSVDFDVNACTLLHFDCSPERFQFT